MRALLFIVALACIVVVACSKDYGEAIGGSCNINSDCDSPLVCAFSRCHDQCTSSRDCPSGERCMTAQYPLHVCQLDAEKSCTNDTDCPFGKRCAVDNQCRDACSYDRNCPGGQLCVQGTCADSTEAIADGAAPKPPPYEGLPFVGASSNGPVRANQLNVVTPPGVVAGDVMVGAIATSGGGINPPPPGWTKIGDLSQYQASGPVVAAAWYWRIVEASEPPAHTFTFASTGSESFATVAVAYRGIDVHAPIDATSTAPSVNGMLEAPSVTASASGDVLVALFFQGEPTVRWTAPAGMTKREDTGLAGVFDQIVSAGDTGPRTGVSSAPTANQIAVLVALKLAR